MAAAGLADRRVSVLIPLVTGILGNLWLVRRGRPVADSRLPRLIDDSARDLGLSRGVTLLLLPRGQMPMTFGFLRSYMVLPADALCWTDEQLRVVLLHELAHVKRHDVSWQMVARVACALYWFHPLVWWALRRMRVDREFACDDCVLATGQKASRYATHLLEIARVHRSCSPLATAAISMARRSQLEGRLLAVLDVQRARTPLGSARAVTLLFSTVCAVLSLGVLRLAVQAEPVPAADRATAAETTAGDEKNADEAKCALSGRIVDDTGAPVTDATIEMSFNRGGTDLTARTDEAGRYAFEKVAQAGEYRIRITSKRWIGVHNRDAKTVDLVERTPAVAATSLCRGLAG